MAVSTIPVEGKYLTSSGGVFEPYSSVTINKSCCLTVKNAMHVYFVDFTVASGGVPAWQTLFKIYGTGLAVGYTDLGNNIFLNNTNGFIETHEAIAAGNYQLMFMAA